MWTTLHSYPYMLCRDDWMDGTLLSEIHALVSLIDRLISFFPCAVCRSHLSEMLPGEKAYLEVRLTRALARGERENATALVRRQHVCDTLVVWLFLLHNRVTARVGKGGANADYIALERRREREILAVLDREYNIVYDRIV